MPDTRLNVHARFDVRGRTAVITGGSGHLGRAMASALAQAGVQVAILGQCNRPLFFLDGTESGI